jgi:hypothetical protein
MRVIQLGRVGGRLALLAGFAVWSLASANSITYFYGYNSPGLTAWQTQDAFAAQNVQFVPQLPMVSTGVGTFTPWSTYGSPASASSFSGVSTANNSFYGGSEYSSASFGAATSSFNATPFDNGSGYGAYAGYGGYGAVNTPAVNSGGGGFFFPTATYTNVNGFASWNAWHTPAGGGMSEAPQLVGLDVVSDLAIARVSTNFAAPSVLPEIVPPSARAALPGAAPVDSFGTPEPASIGLMAAGLLSLLYLRRRC